MLKRQRQNGSSRILCQGPATAHSFPFFLLPATASPDWHLPLCSQICFCFFLLFSVSKWLGPANSMPLCQWRMISFSPGREGTGRRPGSKRKRGAPPSSLLWVGAVLGVAGQPCIVSSPAGALPGLWQCPLCLLSHQ